MAASIWIQRGMVWVGLVILLGNVNGRAATPPSDGRGREVKPRRAESSPYQSREGSLNTPPSAETTLSAAALRGRTLYLDGVHADGRPLVALSGESGLPLPAAFVACVKCHGHDARGKSEGGTVSSDIRGETLAKPYALTLPGGRRSAPYDEALFFTAIAQGRDSTGHALNSSMPRYSLSPEEAADVFAFLRRVGDFPDEGVTDDSIKVGIITCGDPEFAATMANDRRILAAWCAEVNRRGGIFRRRIELLEIDGPIGNSAPPVVALLAGSHAPAIGCVSHGKIPVLRVRAEFGEDDHFVFSLFLGVVERTLALVRYAQLLNQSPPLHFAVVYPESRTSSTLLKAIAAVMPADTLFQPTPPEGAPTDALISILRDAGIGSAVLLGEEKDFDSWRTRASVLSWAPLFLTSAAAEFKASRGNVVGVKDASPADLSPEAVRLFQQCAGENSVTEPDRADSLGLLATAELLRLALENAGREVTREKLIETLTGFSEVRTGFAPPGGFSARRHTAARGIYVVPLAPSASQPKLEWINLE